MLQVSQCKTFYAFFISNFRELRLGFLILFGRVLVVAPIPLLFQIMIDKSLAENDFIEIMIIAMFITGLLVMHFALGVAGVINIGRKVISITHEIRKSVYSSIQDLSVSYLDGSSSGRLLSKYISDVQKVQDTFHSISFQVIPDILYGVLTLVVLVILDWRLSIFVTLVIPIYYFIRLVFEKNLKEGNRNLRMAQESLTGKASEFISAIRLIRCFGNEVVAEGELSRTSEYVSRTSLSLIDTKANFWTLMYVIRQMLAVLIVCGGSFLVIYSSFSIGTLVAFLAAMPVLLLPIETLTTLSDIYYKGNESYQSIRELSECGNKENWPGKVRLESLSGNIRFINVVFFYSRTPKNVVLNRLNLELKNGENLALVGRSGSGKSTLVNLLLGLYSLKDGQILIDGFSLADLDIGWFRKSCAIVMQDNFLIDGSILENIRFGNPSASDQDVYRAARLANADEFIQGFVDKYGTFVGERGVKLSGGQLQRISIARAVIRNPKILVLDEATSSLDMENEIAIRDAVLKIKEKRTVITIAHRLSTIRSADKVAVLDNGKIVEIGTYSELNSRNGYFRKLMESSQVT